MTTISPPDRLTLLGSAHAPDVIILSLGVAAIFLPRVRYPTTRETSLPATLSSGNEGLDIILKGGLPSRRLYLVEGAPGSGKTTLALQLLREGVRAGEKALYITLSETREELSAVAESHGWNIDDFNVFEFSSASDISAMAVNRAFFIRGRWSLTRQFD